MTFGERVVVGGRDVVPTALVIFGFGGGGGGYVLPIGAYVGGPRLASRPVAAIASPSFVSKVPDER